MAWFRKPPDPISDRARAPTDEIAQIEAQIKQLDSQLQRDQAQPRLRSTALPHGAVSSDRPGTVPPPTAPAPSEPIFESVDQDRLQVQAAADATADYYNDLGVRKYDLPALWERLRAHVRGPATTNPKLVNYLAAGGIQGLRPMRYEKRVARNRLIVLVAFLFFMLLGIVIVFVRNR